MKYLIVLFGVLILAIALVILFRPALIIDQIQRYSHTLSMHLLAIVVRVILGIALLQYADHSKFPLVLQIIGWLSLAAAVVLAAIPRKRIGDLINWILNRFGGHIRIGALAALLFGVFLIYAVL